MFWVNERSLRLRTSMPIESSFSRPRGSTLDWIRCGLECFVGYFGIVVLFVMQRQEQEKGTAKRWKIGVSVNRLAQLDAVRQCMTGHDEPLQC